MVLHSGGSDSSLIFVLPSTSTPVLMEVIVGKRVGASTGKGEGLQRCMGVSCGRSDERFGRRQGMLRLSHLFFRAIPTCRRDSRLCRPRTANLTRKRGAQGPPCTRELHGRIRLAKEQPRMQESRPRVFTRRDGGTMSTRRELRTFCGTSSRC